jgi:hypothetical protein
MGRWRNVLHACLRGRHPTAGAGRREKSAPVGQSGEKHNASFGQAVCLADFAGLSKTYGMAETVLGWAGQGSGYEIGWREVEDPIRQFFHCLRIGR